MMDERLVQRVLAQEGRFKALFLAVRRGHYKTANVLSMECRAVLPANAQLAALYLYEGVEVSSCAFMWVAESHAEDLRALEIRTHSDVIRIERDEAGAWTLHTDSGVVMPMPPRYLMEPHSGFVQTTEHWWLEWCSTPSLEWGGDRFKDATLLPVAWNGDKEDPDHDSRYGDWRPAE